MVHDHKDLVLRRIEDTVGMLLQLLVGVDDVVIVTEHAG